MKDNLFEEIDKQKEEIPLLNKTIKKVEKYEYNFYQKVAIFTMFVCFCAGIVLGNVFPSCQSSGLYNKTCNITEFNIALTILFWFVSFLLSMFIFFMGHVINILSNIEKNMKK